MSDPALKHQRLSGGQRFAGAFGVSGCGDECLRPIFIPQTLISTPAAWSGGSSRIGAASAPDGNGPGNTARLIDVASTNTGSTNEWWVEISGDGANLSFNASSNGVATSLASGWIVKGIGVSPRKVTLCNFRVLWDHFVFAPKHGAGLRGPTAAGGGQPWSALAMASVSPHFLN